MAYVAQEHGAEVISLGPIGPRHADIAHLTRKLPAKAKHLVFVDAAGPCGSWLYRSLRTKGDDCWGGAPSLMPNKAGARVNTDRRDAGHLARLMRSGDLTPVYVPKVEAEAIRDLSRAREATIGDLKAAPFRLQAFLLRHDIRYTGRAHWRPAHLRGLSEVGCPTPAPQIVFQAEVRAVNAPTDRLHRLAPELQAQVTTWRLHSVVEALQALRGVPCPVAVTLVAALGDLTRFAHPRALMTFLGLIPSAYAPGERRRQGSLPQAGPTHARRARVEGAWASRSPAKVSWPLQLRLATPPKTLQDSSWKAQVRLGKRYRRLLARGKQAHQGGVAIARAWVGCLWAIAKEVPVPPEVQKIECDLPPNAEGCQRAWEETQPRCGVTLDGVKRPTGLRVPRGRQAPVGGQGGGNQPTESSRSNRRFLLAPALLMHEGEKTS